MKKRQRESGEGPFCKKVASPDPSPKNSHNLGCSCGTTRALVRRGAPAGALGTEIREIVNMCLAGAPRGEAAKLAHEAGISPSALSKFRKDRYCGNTDQVARKLVQALNSRHAANAIASGAYKCNWLVHGAITGLTLVKTQRTLDRLRTEDQTLHMVQVWVGPQPADIHFVTQGQEEHGRPRGEPFCVKGSSPHPSSQNSHPGHVPAEHAGTGALVGTGVPAGAFEADDRQGRRSLPEQT